MTLTKQKKQIVVLVALVVVVFLVVYFGFMKGKSDKGTTTDVVLGMEPDVNKDTSNFLSSKLDTKILDDARFKALVPPLYPTVSSSDVGVSNPFKESSDK